MDTKICKTKRNNVIPCGEEKPISEFYKGSSLCKECSKLIYNTRKEYHKEYSKIQYETNKEYYIKKREEYRENNPEYFITYRENNKKQINDYSKNHYNENKSYYKEKTYKWKENNPDKWREINKRNMKNSRLQKPHIHRWRYLLKNTIQKSNLNKETETSLLLGYSPSEFKNFMESLDPNWMNYEIDHKIPLSWFKDNTPPNIPNNLQNLQLMDKSSNSSKRNFFMNKVSDQYWEESKKYIKEEIIIKFKL